MDRPGRLSADCVGQMTDAEIRVLQMLLGNALLQVQKLVVLLDADDDPRERAKMTLKAAELAEEAIRQAKKPLRRMIRRG